MRGADIRRVRIELGNLLEGGRPRPPFYRARRRTRTSALQKIPRQIADRCAAFSEKRYAMSLRILRGGVFVPKTAVAHRAEARCHKKFPSSMRTRPTGPGASLSRLQRTLSRRLANIVRRCP